MSKAIARKTRPPVRETDAVLLRLGERVRNLRAIRGMTRKALANDAGVSERFLADLETGVGNASILLLNRLAAALALPLRDILGAGQEPRDDLALSMEVLSRLEDDELREARQLLQSRFPAGAAARRQSRIALIGLRGAGKSTLGKMLADALHCRFIELDQRIEELSGMDTAQIHGMLGQSAYRRYERDALEAVIEDGGRVVIAMPGSIVSEAGTYAYLLTHCYTVWIKASPEEHMARVIAQGDMRPMAGNREAMDDLRRILATREPLYAKADATVVTSQRPLASSLEELRRAIP
jgi:XRE family aerobic/anaerobic benzoate catabolism transcriptional regulator